MRGSSPSHGAAEEQAAAAGAVVAAGLPSPTLKPSTQRMGDARTRAGAAGVRLAPVTAAALMGAAAADAMAPAAAAALLATVVCTVTVTSAPHQPAMALPGSTDTGDVPAASASDSLVTVMIELRSNVVLRSEEADEKLGPLLAAAANAEAAAAQGVEGSMRAHTGVSWNSGASHLDSCAGSERQGGSGSPMTLYSEVAWPTRILMASLSASALSTTREGRAAAASRNALLAQLSSKCDPNLVSTISPSPRGRLTTRNSWRRLRSANAGSDLERLLLGGSVRLTATRVPSGRAASRAWPRAAGCADSSGHADRAADAADATSFSWAVVGASCTFHAGPLDASGPCSASSSISKKGNMDIWAQPEAVVLNVVIAQALAGKPRLLWSRERVSLVSAPRRFGRLVYRHAGMILWAVGESAGSVCLKAWYTTRHV
mmetsp:Transcript_9137/g.22635  ORF Transcript_9137/g.22635 Transcript_9137/m.22635 type:complete len:431 (+) Transcript_9137:2202-3494(+)